MDLPFLADKLESALREMDAESPFGLRGWLKHLRSKGLKAHRGQPDEVAITGSLCDYLTRNGVASEPRAYGSGGFCDIVSTLSENREAWIEAKSYYTIYFDDADVSFSSPRLCRGSQTWKARIEALASDCSNKLASIANAAGLLIGFEVASNVRPLHPNNPSPSAIDFFMRGVVKRRLPGWNIFPLSARGEWNRTIAQCPQFTLRRAAGYGFGRRQ
jgi:hypothetical protein